MTAEQRFTFDEIGDLYDRYRPGYPEDLFEDLLALSGISAGDRILEIGCGTGQATEPLARRGYAMSCLEPGPRLAAIARKNLAAFSGVDGAVDRDRVGFFADRHRVFQRRHVRRRTDVFRR